MEKNRVRVVRSPGFLTAVMLAFVFLLTFNCTTAFAWGWTPGQGWTYAIWPPPTPKDPLDIWYLPQYVNVSCYDYETHALLNCPFSYSITEDFSPLGIGNGGHTHSRMFGTGIGALSGAMVAQLSQWDVRGETANKVNVVMYDRPEMSGAVIQTAVVRAPPGYFCWPDGSMAACTIIYHIDFQLRNLIPLPPSAANEYTLTGQNASNLHGDNHYGTQRLVAAIAEVAKNFQDFTGRPMGINDMSLPWGGLYDFHNDGVPPHKSHRKGTSVDIDSVTVLGMTLQPDAELQWELTKMFSLQDCIKINEATIHYECK